MCAGELVCVVCVECDECVAWCGGVCGRGAGVCVVLMCVVGGSAGCGEMVGEVVGELVWGAAGELLEVRVGDEEGWVWPAARAASRVRCSLALSASGSRG